MKKTRPIKTLKRYSEEFKRARISEYDKGEYSAQDLCRLFSVPIATFYTWIPKYSTLDKHNVVIVESKDSGSEKLSEYENRIKELERNIGQKQIKIDYLEKMIDIAKEDFKIDIKKNSDTPQSIGSTQTKAK